MDDQKIEKFAKNIAGLLPENVVTPQDCHDKLKRIFNNQRDFFSRFDPKLLLKTIIYVYSFKKTNGFDLARNILNNLFFAKIFKYNGDNFVEECENCDGNGYVDCDYCGGRGDYQCDECEGSGELTCKVCDGSGEIEGERCDECDGRGVTSCDYCEGDGRQSCNDCNGNGSQDCDSCDGNGEVKTNDLAVTTYQICCWDKELKDKCELYEGEKTPVISDEDFDSISDYIILGMEDNDRLFTEETDESNLPEMDMLYCLAYDDEPKIRLLSGSHFGLIFRNLTDSW